MISQGQHNQQITTKRRRNKIWNISKQFHSNWIVALATFNGSWSLFDNLKTSLTQLFQRSSWKSDRGTSCKVQSLILANMDNELN